MPALPVTRSPVRLHPNPTRLIVKPYLPHDEGPAEGRNRVQRVIHRVLGLPLDQADRALDHLRVLFEGRHPDLDGVYLRGFQAVEHLVDDAAELPDAVRRLIGAYFMHEYSLEGAALTNPSIVVAPDQSGLADGWLRVLVSLRAVGEGHVSSIEIRTGLLGPDGEIDVAAAGPPVSGDRHPPMFDKELFTTKLEELGVDAHLVRFALGHLDDRFTMATLEGVLADLTEDAESSTTVLHFTQVVHWLASSNYDLVFAPDTELSSRVLFPSGPTESRGMEDARFVRFVEPDGAAVYYATYTAFDGFSILPQLIETTDFEVFRIATLNGPAARNKGMAIFPRRIDGQYVALGRLDGESSYLMRSDNIRFWHHAEQIQLPAHPWELMQIGNCGAPIETEAGWVVVTHGVGPMRRYSLGAILLDIADPSRVIGHLREPLLVPEEDERDGYVPNVVYSCGSIIHGGRLVLAYGISDTSTGFATVPLDSLLSELATS